MSLAKIRYQIEQLPALDDMNVQLFQVYQDLKSKKAQIATQLFALMQNDSDA